MGTSRIISRRGIARRRAGAPRRRAGVLATAAALVAPVLAAATQDATSPSAPALPSYGGLLLRFRAVKAAMRLDGMTVTMESIRVWRAELGL